MEWIEKTSVTEEEAEVEAWSLSVPPSAHDASGKFRMVVGLGWA